MNFQCCSSQIENFCGTSQEGMQYVIDKLKNKELTTNGGYISTYLIGQKKKLLINFSQPENTIFIPPNKFEVATYNSTIIKREKYSKVDKIYSHLGSINDAFEKLYSGQVISKTIELYRNTILSYTNLGIIFCNTGIIGNDIRLTDNEIDLNIIDKDVEMVVRINYVAIDDPILDKYVASSNHISKIPSIKQGNIKLIPQRIYINNFTNEIVYSETYADVSKNISITYRFLPITIDNSDPISKKALADSINSQIIDQFNQSTHFYYELDFDWISDESIPGNYGFVCIFTCLLNPARDPLLIMPIKKELKVLAGRRNSFGIESGQSIEFDVNGIIRNNIQTLYYNVVYYSDSFTTNLIHEFCHILGMIHEFSRNIPENPYQNNVWVEGYQRNIMIQPNQIGIGLIDYDSVMMYVFNRCVFKKQYQTNDRINTRWNSVLSRNDTLTLADMYNPFFSSSQVYNISSNLSFFSDNKLLISIIVIVIIILILAIFIVIITKHK
jgi:hypothetical protein